MRGAFEDQGGLFSYISPEAQIPASHPLRKIRELVREVLSELNRSLFRPPKVPRMIEYTRSTDPQERAKLQFPSFSADC